MVQINRKTPKSYLNRPVGVVNVSTGAYEANMSIARSLEGISNNLFQVAQQEIKEDRIQEGKEFAANAVVYQDGQFKQIDTSNLRGSARKVADDLLREKYLTSAKADFQSQLADLEVKFNNQEEGYKTPEELRDNMSVYIGETTQKIKEFDPILADEFRQLGETLGGPAYAGFQIAAANREAQKAKDNFNQSFALNQSINTVAGQQGNIKAFLDSLTDVITAARAAGFKQDEIDNLIQKSYRTYYDGAKARLADLPKEVRALVTRDMVAGILSEESKKYFPDLEQILPNLTAENRDKLAVEFKEVNTSQTKFEEILDLNINSDVFLNPESKGAGKSADNILARDGIALAHKNVANFQDEDIVNAYGNLPSVPNSVRSDAKRILNGSISDPNEILGTIAAIELITGVDSAAGKFYDSTKGISSSDLLALRSISAAISADPEDAVGIVERTKALRTNPVEYNKILISEFDLDKTVSDRSPVKLARDYLVNQGYPSEFANANANGYAKAVATGLKDAADEMLELAFDSQYPDSNYIYNPVKQTGIFGGTKEAFRRPYSPESEFNSEELEKFDAKLQEITKDFDGTALVMPTFGSQTGSVRWAVVDQDGQYVLNANGEPKFIHSSAIRDNQRIEKRNNFRILFEEYKAQMQRKESTEFEGLRPSERIILSKVAR